MDLTAEIEERPPVKAIFGSTVWTDPQGAPSMERGRIGHRAEIRLDGAPAPVENGKHGYRIPHDRP
ncbi:hypothetical protein [Rhodovulum marinum]|uniref:hypothetical protein n=1 Tax=Rhodovulum marinum TaxID=320662 RepID=UPI0010480BAE|nr:hypothetical protein [Rhodovulum marinum]